MVVPKVRGGSVVALAAACVASTACGGSSIREEDGPDGAPATGGSTGGSPATTDDRLLPLEVGRRWMLQRSTPDPSRPGGCQGPLESSVVGRVTRGADTGWEYHPACTSLVVQMFMNEDDIWAYLSTDPGTRFEYASPPVEEGAAWGAGAGVRYIWHDEGTVQVTAGTFERCWRRSYLPTELSFIVLCRGVGIVIIDAPEENYRVELVGKNF